MKPATGKHERGSALIVTLGFFMVLTILLGGAFSRISNARKSSEHAYRQSRVQATLDYAFARAREQLVEKAVFEINGDWNNVTWNAVAKEEKQNRCIITIQACPARGPSQSRRITLQKRSDEMWVVTSYQ